MYRLSIELTFDGQFRFDLLPGYDFFAFTILRRLRDSFVNHVFFKCLKYPWLQQNTSHLTFSIRNILKVDVCFFTL